MILVYTTTSSLSNAKLIAQNLVKLKLAACINIIDKVHSIYLWDGKVCDDLEFSLIIKTKKELFAQVKKEINNHHDYDIPCIISIPVDKIDHKFEKWLNSMI